MNGGEREASAFKETGSEKTRREQSSSSGWRMLIGSLGRRGMGDGEGKGMRDEDTGKK